MRNKLPRHWNSIARKFVKDYRGIFPGLLSAAMVVISFPDAWLWPFLFVALVPLFLAIFYARNYRDVFVTGFVCGMFVLIGGFYWITFVAENFGGIPWILAVGILLGFSLFAEQQVLIFSALLYYSLRQLSRMRKKAPLLGAIFIFAPALYVGVDFLYPKIFPATFGYCLHGWLALAQIAEYTGVFGLTFAAFFINVSLAVLIVSYTSRRYPTQLEIPWRGLRYPAMGVLLIGMAALWVLSNWGSRRIQHYTDMENSSPRHVRVAMIQANIGDVDKLASERGYYPAMNQVLQTYKELSLQAVVEHRPDLIIWPETAYPMIYGGEYGAKPTDQWMENLVKELQVPVLFGGYAENDHRDFNTAFLLGPDGKLGGRYLKTILLPFGEYVPLGPFGSIVHDWIPTIADFGRGRGPTVFEVPQKKSGFRISPQICYEGVIPEFSQTSVSLGAEILVNITNDSWFGAGSEPAHHLLLTSFRTIEERRPLIRTTNTGYTIYVDASGRYRTRGPLFEKASVYVDVVLPPAGEPPVKTFFQRHGELFAHLCVVLSGAMLLGLAAYAASRRKKGHSFL